MKKYALGLFLIFGFLGFGLSAKAACKNSNGRGNIEQGHFVCGILSGHSGNNFWFRCNKNGMYTAFSSGTRGCTIGAQAEAYSPSIPVSISEPIMSPVPKIGSQPNQYGFKTITLPQATNQASDTYSVMFNDDPITIGHKNPLLDSAGNQILDNYGNPIIPTTVNVNQNDNTIGMVFNTGLFSGITWPPESLFDNISIWGQPLADTFKTFIKGTSGDTSKWYPVNLFSVPNPTSAIPLIPVTINWKAVPGAVTYHFKLSVADNPLGLDINIPVTGINIPNMTTRSYFFMGRGMVSYNWSAIPLDSAGNEILGSDLISHGDLGTGGDIGTVSNGYGTVTSAYLANPFWINSATVADQAAGSGSNVWQLAQTQFCGIYAGHMYFTDKYGLRCEGGPHPLTFIEWDKIYDTLGNEAVKYEIQYAFQPIPESTSFSEGATFTTTYPVIYTQGTSTGTGTFTTHVIGNITQDLKPTQRNGFQYDFNGIPPQGGGSAGQGGFNADGSIAGVYWRVRGIDVNGKPIKENITPGGIIFPPIPATPFQSILTSWNKVAGATGYVVDVAEKASDFANFPRLSTTDPVTQTIQITDPVTGITQTLYTPLPFMLRRVVTDTPATSAGEIVVAKFKKLLTDARVYQGDLNDANGLYYSLLNPAETYPVTGGVIPDPYDFQPVFDAAVADWLAMFKNPSGFTESSYNDILGYQDFYYPHLDDASALGLYISSPASNKLTLHTNTPILIKNKSQGKAWLGVNQNTAKTETTLTFGTINNVPSIDGSYAFEITRKGSPSASFHFSDYYGDNFWDFNSTTNYPITFNSFGPVSLAGDLTGKSYTEFNKVVPGTKYYYRTRAFSTNPTDNSAFTWYPWSAISSVTTPTGVPASITIGSDGTISESPFQMKGEIFKSVSSVASGQKSAIASKATLADSLKKNQDRVAAHKALLKAYSDLVSARTKADLVSKTALKKASDSLQSAAKVYTNRRVDIQVSPVR